MSRTGKDRKSERETKRTHIVLVDDHPVVGKGIATLFRTTFDFELSGQAVNCVEAKGLIERLHPDLVLLDLSLPGQGGLELLKDLQASHPELPVIVLSMFDENAYAERVLRAGGKGYVMKQEPGDKLLTAIRCVLAGNVFVSPPICMRLISSYTPGPAARRKGTDVLYDREMQVYSMIGHGMATPSIAAQLNLSPKTVQSYREHIKRKLGLRSSTDLIHSATRWAQSQCVK